MKQLFTILLVVGLAAILSFNTGCGGDDNPAAPEPDPALTVSTSSLDFGTGDTQKTFTITNSGGGTLEWSISESEAWLTVAPANGTTTSETDQITVTVDRENLPVGPQQSTISVTSTASNATVTVSLAKGRVIWSYDAGTQADFNANWECGDDEFLSGVDYWGIIDTDTHTGNSVVWCNGTGDYPVGTYDSYMDAYMYQRSDDAVVISGYSEVVVRFWMKGETEDINDFVYLVVRGNDDNWHFRDEAAWTGTGDFTWSMYDINLSMFGNDAPTNFLRIGFGFFADYSLQFRGVYIDDIEIWGIE